MASCTWACHITVQMLTFYILSQFIKINNTLKIIHLGLKNDP